MSEIALPPLIRYRERAEPRDTALERFARGAVSHALAFAPDFLRSRSLRFARRVLSLEDTVAALSDHALVEAIRGAGASIRRGRSPDEALLARLFAGVREASARSLGLRQFEVQVMGAHVLWSGALAEMATGEGKTATAALCAASAALTGTSAHVVTVNDYLAERDAAAMRPLYAFLGLSVGSVTGAMSSDERRRAYRCDVSYCTNKELVFDYLRDRSQLGDRRGPLRLKLDAWSAPSAAQAPLLHGLHFAIIDEADSVLIDEARMPLILSGESEGPIDSALADQALDLVRQLEPGRDWGFGGHEQQIVITDAGADRVAALGDVLGGQWTIPILRDELVRHALSALHLFHVNEHYLVRDNRVTIIDEFTGRGMPDRQWTNGLHQMIERKEGCTATTRRTAVARLTYQRFFRRYCRLSGMTGTAAEVARELWWVYGLQVVRVPTNRPSRRRCRGDRVFASEQDKWQAVAARVGELRRAGAAVLLGTRTVQASIEASRHLALADIPHVVLSAAQDRTEAEIVMAAGQPGRVTVATNMAGRGTDIRLAPTIATGAGLHVILTERHDARRIDRQLAGRCGRQGDPGCFEALLSLDDALLAETGAAPVARVLARWLAPIFGTWPGIAAIWWAQRRLERAHFRMRRELMRIDRANNDNLAFAGRGE